MMREQAKGFKKQKGHQENQNNGCQQVYKKALSCNKFKHVRIISEKISAAI
jgi:hypothetical protein